MGIIYLLIGLIQGLTEFLPVSSSGHIVLFGEIFKIDCDIILLNVVVHLGTLVSVIFCMRKKIFSLIKKPMCKTNKMLVVSTLPAVIIVLLFHTIVDKMYSNMFLVYGFIITGIMLVLCEMFNKGNKPLSYKTALKMGLMQGVAILPGISRSGSTLAVAMMDGVDKNEACEYSFLMSIPVILASAVWEGVKLVGKQIEFNILPLGLAFISSVVFGILSIKIMMKVLKKNKLYYFSIYLIFLSIISLIVFLR